MPTNESGYVSLETIKTTGSATTPMGSSEFRSVYNSTTEPSSGGGGNSVIKSVKRAIGQAMGTGGGGANASPLLIPDGNEYR